MALRSAIGHGAGCLTLVSGMPGDFQGAIAAYTQAIELDPNHFKAYFNRGFAHDKLGQFDKAIFDYSKALLIEPNNAYAFYNRGISHDRRWVCHIAYVCHCQALTCCPRFFFFVAAPTSRKPSPTSLAPSNYCRITLTSTTTGGSAIGNRGTSQLPSTTTRAPSSPTQDISRPCTTARSRMIRWVGTCQLCGDKCAQGPTLASPQVGKYEEAVADYTRAISLDPSNANAFHNRGSSFDKMGRLSEAVEDFTKAIELDPRNASSYNSRGLARDKLGARNEALADFTTAIGLDSKSAVFWHNRGYCLRNMYVPCVPVAYRGCLTYM